MVSLAHAQSSKPRAMSSAMFDEDDRGFENSKPPSDAVLDALLATSDVKEGLEDIEGQSRNSLRSYFKAVVTDAGTLQVLDCQWLQEILDGFGSCVRATMKQM